MHNAAAMMMMRMSLLSLAVAFGGCTIGEEIAPPKAPHRSARAAGLFGLQYNIVVNGQFEPSAPGGYVPLDEGHAIGVRNNVVLESGPDGWHGENFSLPY